MKEVLTLILIVGVSRSTLFSQDCDTLLGYAKDDKYSIFMRESLKGTVINNPTDSMHGVFTRTNYFKTPKSTGIMVIFFFIRCGKLFDESVKVKIEFMDGTTIFLKRSIYDKDTPGDAGTISLLVGGDYGNIYELTLLRTKSISKISISGDQIDSYTYVADPFQSQNFMVGMQCLSNLLK